MTTEIYRTSHGNGPHLFFQRTANGKTLVGLGGVGLGGVQVLLDQAEWGDFLRTANADAAQFAADRGPYEKPEEPSRA